MTTVSAIFSLALADFRERSRRYSFWIFLFVIGYATYLFLPPQGAPYTTVRLDAYRGLYNSAWISSQVTLLTVTILSLVSFYFIKGAVTREQRLKTQELIAASPVSNFQYLCGKFVSNCLVLFSMIAVLAITSALMQLARGEDRSIDIAALLAPYLLVITPLLIFVAAVAIFFDSVKLLRGGIGNVAFFFCWVFMMVLSGADTSKTPPSFDFFGMRYLLEEMMQGCAAAFSNYVPWEGQHSIGFNFVKGGEAPMLTTFVWSGAHWSSAFLFSRVVVLCAAVAAIFTSAALFRRFDEERSAFKPPSFKKAAAAEVDSAPSPGTSAQVLKPTTLTPIISRSAKLGLARLLTAELRIALNGVSKWWYLVAAGIFVAGLLTPLSISHKFLLAAAWFWPMLIWSKMGCRDQLFDTSQMVGSTPGGIWAQLSMSWLAGFLIALAIGGFIGIKSLLAGDLQLTLQWIIGAAFIPSFAIFCGIITGARKLFEVFYTILFYMGPLNKVPIADFTGSVVYQDALTTVAITAAVIAGLLFATVSLRKWQLLRA